MKDQLQAFGRRIWKDFRAFSPGQKAVTIAAVLALAIGGFLLMTWKSTPTYAPLYTNLAPADASAIVDKLNSSGTPYQLSAGGTEVLVPQADVYSTRLTMSTAGLPGSSQTGYSLLDKEGVTTSQFQQQIDYQRAIEGELAKTIQAINGVQAASVHLAIPQQDVFNDGSQKPTAAVLLAVTSGTTLTSGQVQSVIYLVSSSVPGMSADKVTVTDSNGAVLAAPGQNITSAAGADNQAQITQAYNDRISSGLQAMLDRALGPGTAVVSVNSLLDFNKSSTTQQTYIYNKLAPPLSQQSTTETYNGAGAAAGGTLGATGTTPTTPATANGKYNKTSKIVDNALGTNTKTTENAPGQLQHLSIAVLLDKSAKNVNVTTVSNLVKAGVGFTKTRGDTLSVQAMPFNNTAQKAATALGAAATKAAAAKVAQEHLMSLAKQGALGVLVLGVLIATWLATRRRRKHGDDEPANDDLFGLDDDGPIMPATMHERLSEQMTPPVDVNGAAARRRNLVAVADDRPEDVARVLSGWLNTKES